MEQDDTREFLQGQIVRHFKRETADPDGRDYLYEIVGEAEDTETGKKLMVYRAMYGTCGLYARPLEMFLSEVDHSKYPAIHQKYRFEHLNND